MSAFLTLLRADDAACTRSRVVWAIAGAGVVWGALVAFLARTADGDTARQAALQADGASLLLLAGLCAAITLGAGAFPGDAHTGYLGLVAASGASRDGIAVARVLMRLATLAAIMVLWWAVLEAGSFALGLGYDHALTGHALAMIVNVSLALTASALMSSLIGAVAAGVFGLMIFISAQAVVNLKAALDQGAIAQSSSELVTPFYVALPRAIVSPMMEGHQRDGVTSLAAPQLEVNGVDVVVHASPWQNVVWTLAWIVVLVYLTTLGFRRRQL